MTKSIFRRSLVRCGNTTYKADGNGVWCDIGNISGDSLLSLATQMRLPVVHVFLDRRTCPQPELRRSNQTFVFDQPQPVLSTWRTEPPKGI